MTRTALLPNSIFANKRKKNRVFAIAVGAVLVLMCVSLIVPFVWGFTASFKDRLAYIENAFSFPWPLKFSNYADAYDHFAVQVSVGSGSVTYNFLGMLLFTVIYAVGGALIQTLAGALVAYAVARFPRFKMSKVLYGIVIVTMILPIVGAAPSEIRMLRALHLWNTIPGILLLKANFLGTYFLVFHAFFAGLPKDYFEAAELDGAGHWKILLHIVFPLAKGILWTVIILYFLGNWNDYNMTMIYAPSIPTIAYGLYTFNFSTASAIADTPHKMAGAMILFLPVLIFFCIFSDKFIGNNLSIGGLKE